VVTASTAPSGIFNDEASDPVFQSLRAPSQTGGDDGVAASQSSIITIPKGSGHWMGKESRCISQEIFFSLFPISPMNSM